MAAERQGNLAAYFPIILQRYLIIAIDFITRKLCMRVRRDTVDALHTERECLSLALWG